MFQNMIVPGQKEVMESLQTEWNITVEKDAVSVSVSAYWRIL